MASSSKWGRLYGGAAGIILLDGESAYMDEPLDYRLIMPGSYKGLLILDRWSGISPELELVSDITHHPVDGLHGVVEVLLQLGVTQAQQISHAGFVNAQIGQKDQISNIKAGIVPLFQFVKDCFHHLYRA